MFGPVPFPPDVTDIDGQRLWPGLAVTPLSGIHAGELCEVVGWGGRRGLELLVHAATPDLFDEKPAEVRVLSDYVLKDPVTRGRLVVADPAPTSVLLHPSRRIELALLRRVLDEAILPEELARLVSVTVEDERSPSTSDRMAGLLEMWTLASDQPSQRRIGDPRNVVLQASGLDRVLLAAQLEEEVGPLLDGFDETVVVSTPDSPPNVVELLVAQLAAGTWTPQARHITVRPGQPLHDVDIRALTGSSSSGPV